MEGDGAQQQQHHDPTAPLGAAWPHAFLRVFPGALPRQGVAAVLAEARPLAAQRDNWWVPRAVLDAGPASARTAAEAAICHLWHTAVLPALTSKPAMAAAAAVVGGADSAGTGSGSGSGSGGGAAGATAAAMTPRAAPPAAAASRVAGAEYWVQLYRPGAGLAFHFDKDEARLVRDGVMRHPLLSSVLYLTGGPPPPPPPSSGNGSNGNGSNGNGNGAAAAESTTAAGLGLGPLGGLFGGPRWREQGPTVVLEQLFDASAGRPTPDAPRRGALVFPRSGGYCLFDGRLGHGVLDSFDRSAPRATLLVNFWTSADDDGEEGQEEEEGGAAARRRQGEDDEADDGNGNGSTRRPGRRRQSQDNDDGDHEDDPDPAAAPTSPAASAALLKGLAAATAPGAPLGVRRPAAEELASAGLAALDPPPGEAEVEHAWPWAAASARLAARAAAATAGGEDGGDDAASLPAPPPLLPRAARLAIASLQPPPGAERCPQTADDMMAAAGVALGGGPAPPMMLRGPRPLSPAAAAAAGAAATVAFEHDGSWVLMPLDVDASGGGDLQCAAVFLPAEMIEEEDEDEDEGEDEGEEGEGGAAAGSGG
jgi:hypothetical protein